MTQRDTFKSPCLLCQKCEVPEQMHTGALFFEGNVITHGKAARISFLFPQICSLVLKCIIIV
jgi:hypothetical protein